MWVTEDFVPWLAGDHQERSHVSPFKQEAGASYTCQTLPCSPICTLHVPLFRAVGRRHVMLTIKRAQKVSPALYPCSPGPVLPQFFPHMFSAYHLAFTHTHTPILFLPMTCLSTFPDVQSNLADLAVPFSWAPPGNILKH